MNLGKVNPKHLVYASGACLSLGVILPLLIVTHVIINTPMALLFFIYILQVIGIVIGVILPLLIVTHVIINTPMALLFFIYILQVIGIVIGIIGIFSMVRKGNEK